MTLDKYVYYECDNLPKNGWMQECLGCRLITRFTIFYHQDEKYRYYIYLCKPCQNKNLFNLKTKFNCCKNKMSK